MKSVFSHVLLFHSTSKLVSWKFVFDILVGLQIVKTILMWASIWTKLYARLWGEEQGPPRQEKISPLCTPPFSMTSPSNCSRIFQNCLWKMKLYLNEFLHHMHCFSFSFPYPFTLRWILSTMRLRDEDTLLSLLTNLWGREPEEGRSVPFLSTTEGRHKEKAGFRLDPEA